VKELPLTAVAIKTGNNRAGFTLIELMIVMTIVGILAAIAVPNYQWALIRAREAVLQENLYGIRSAIDQYFADQGSYPDKLDDLITRKYLREIPRDPFTKKNDTWITVPPPAELPPENTGSNPQPTGVIPLPKGTIYDVQSGSELMDSNNKPYKEW
jgi:general secretion pathway protein G